MRSHWIFSKPSRLGLTASGALLAVLVIFVLHRLDAPEAGGRLSEPSTKSSRLPVPSIFSAPQFAQSAQIAPPPAAAETAAFTCAGQRLELSVAGANRPQCVGIAKAVHNGSMRTYRAEARDSGARWLNIDTAAGAVVAASIGQGGTAEFACDGEACAGLVLGPPDLQGVREVALNGVRLADVSAGGQGETSGVTLTGHVTTGLDETDSPVCRQQSVLVSAQGLPTQRFCPDDGTGIDNADPLGPVYTFGSVDGVGITVALDRDGRVRRVEQGGRSCEGAACASVTVSSLGADGARHVDFNGALLQQAGIAGAWTSLTGRLVIP